MIRVIATPLITSVANGIDAPGWMYPAILDVVTAILAVHIVIAIWKWWGFTVWTFTIVYFTLSIVDHIGALTNLTLIGEPIAFEQFNGGGNPYTAPAVQTVLEVTHANATMPLPLAMPMLSFRHAKMQRFGWRIRQVQGHETKQCDLQNTWDAHYGDA